MKRTDLVNALEIVKPSVSQKPFLPILSCVCFRDGKLIGYNDSTAIETNLTVPFSGAVKADIFSKLVGLLSPDDIEAVIGTNPETGTKELVVTGGRSRFAFPIFDPEEFFFSIPSAPPDAINIPLTKELMEGVKLCLISTPLVASHPSERGVTLSLPTNSTTNSIILYSTDNKSMCRYSIGPAPTTTQLFIIPTEFCQQVVNLYKGSGTLYLTTSWVVAHLGSTKVFSKLVEAPNSVAFESVLKQYERAGFIPVPFFLKDALERALAITSGSELKRTQFKLQNQKLILLSSSKEGEVKDETILRTIHPDIEFLTDPEIVARVLDFSEQVKFYSHGALFQGSAGKFCYIAAALGA